MANTYNGLGVLWGLSSTIGTITGLGALSLAQSEEATLSADEELIRDPDGNTKTVVKYDHKAKATLEFIPTSSSNTGTITVTMIPAGATVAITDANLTTVGGTWIVDDCVAVRSNTKELMARVSLSKYITNTVPA